MATIFEVGIERRVDLNDLKVPLRGSLRAESVQVLDYQHQNDSSQGESRISYLPPCGCCTANEVETLSRFWHRFCWLVTLLLLQSLSSFILRHFGNLLVKHPVVVFFLTMVIGSGGNAGSQSAVLVIRTIAKGTLNSTDRLSKLVQKELWTGGCLSLALTASCFIRVYFFDGNRWEVAAICISMLLIVFTAVLIGTSMPLGLWWCGYDPAHASAAIQVIIDIVGVSLTCLVSTILLSTASPKFDPPYS